MFKTVSFQVLINSIKVKSGAYTLVSLPISISIYESLKLIFKDVKNEDIVLPILTSTILILLYFIFFMIDFATGMIASNYEEKQKGNKDWVESTKLYKSIGKIAGILLINLVFLTIILFLIGVKYDLIADWVLVTLVLINVLAILYEYHSIGENWKRRTGTLPPIFAFFDKVTTLVEEKIIKKIDSKLE